MDGDDFIYSEKDKSNACHFLQTCGFSVIDAYETIYNPREESLYPDDERRMYNEKYRAGNV